MKTRTVFLIAITLISISIIAACGYSKVVSAHLNEGELAPKFDLVNLDNNKVNLEDFTGERVYIKYWASWCSICLAGLEELDTLAGQNNDFQVLSIVSPNFNGEMSGDELRKWFEKLSIENVTVLLDDHGTWAEKFGVLAYPTSYYVGTDGVLAKTIIGHNTNDLIKSEIQDIK